LVPGIRLILQKVKDWPFRVTSGGVVPVNWLVPFKSKARPVPVAPNSLAKVISTPSASSFPPSAPAAPVGPAGPTSP